MSVKGEQSLQQIVFVKPDVHVLRVKPHYTQTATPVSRVNPETITLLEENVVLTSLIYISAEHTHKSKLDNIKLKLFLEAGEMAHWVACLLPKCEDLSSEPSTQVKSWAWPCSSLLLQCSVG